MNLWSTLLELDKINEGIYDNFDSKPSLNNWVTTNGQKVNLNSPQPTAVNQPTQPTSTQPAKPVIASANGKPIVVIVSDKGRLRAFGTDGVNPAGFVAFPNNLRQFEGQKYEVDQLIWNGKNYRVSGNIKEITTPNLTTSAGKTHPNSGLVMNNYANNLSYHISELEDEGDAEDSVEYFESFPDILEVIQSGSDIIFKLSSIPEDDDVIYWILTYSLGNVGNDIAENGRYSARAAEIIISEADFTNALNNNLN